jgi:hypothetical protein
VFRSWVPALWETVMVDRLFDAFFGCWHGNYSFPISTRSGSRRKSAAASLTETYVVCLDCGRELPYDWEDMKVIGTQADQRQYAQSLATKHAA